MIFTTKEISILRENCQMPIDDFLNHPIEQIAGESYKRKVLFIRYIGEEEQPLVHTINQIDQHFLKQSESTYVRVSCLNHMITPKDSQIYIEMYEKWEKQRDAKPNARFDLKFPIHFEDDTLEWTQKCAFEKTVQLFEATNSGSNPSILKNFGVKLLGWMNFYLPGLIKKQAIGYPKFVYVGTIKRQELLFLYFLSLMGCDILYMNPMEDVKDLYPECNAFSEAYLCANRCKEMPTIPSLKEYTISLSSSEQRHVSEQHYEVNTSPSQKSPNRAIQVESRRESHQVVTKRELSYEELAKLSTSIVMISVLNEKGEVLGTGSGVAIHEDGYILTNFHVVRGGVNFGIRFENEDDGYTTNRIIKYHEQYDLAVIKVEKKCLPIPVYIGSKLVRGQKIVAIGSPMGLFNTISDGIISAFRNTSNVPMIQFTAPISHGSSGGAVLDLYGRLIGISTCGIDEGQNLNLAVDNATIYLFANQFLEKSEG